MIDIKTLTDEKIDQLIDSVDRLIQSDISVDKNAQTLQLLQHEKIYRENQNTGVSTETQEMKTYRQWRNGESSELPQAVVVDDITLTSNTVQVSFDEVMSDKIHLDSAFRYHSDGHIDYSKLSKEELETQ